MSGVGTIVLNFGDGSAPVRAINTTLLRTGHRYARPGDYTISIVALDKAGNRSDKVTRRIHIGK
jgi:hypothetical protein